MKKSKVAILACLIAALTIGATTQINRKHECVVLIATQIGSNPQNPDGSYSGYRYDDIVIYSSSSSSGAPKFPKAVNLPTGGLVGDGGDLVSLSEAIAQLMELGYRVQFTSANGLTVRMVK